MQNYAVINLATGLVENSVVWDGSEDWVPPEGYQAIETSSAGIGWSYGAGVFVAPPVAPPAAADILAANMAMQAALNSQAASAMMPLLLSLQLGTATDAETTSAKAWQAYSRALQVIDLTAPKANWPTIPI